MKYEHLLNLLHSSEQSKRGNQIGLELERIGLFNEGFSFSYSPKNVRGVLFKGVKDLLSECEKKHGWEMLRTAEGEPISMVTPYGKVTLEPGGQLELSTDVASNLSLLDRTIQSFESKIEEITNPWGVKWTSLGLNPKESPLDVELIPSARYQIMDQYLSERGTLARHMMRLTASVQINLDYLNEDDAIEMFRVSLLLSPLSYALFANSPFLNSKETGFLSYRYEIWRNTDPDRTGVIQEVWDRDFSFKKYAEFIWNRPLMYAQNEEGKYVETYGQSLSDIEGGKLKGVTASKENQMNALRELFFESRLKPGYVEIRSVDGQNAEGRNSSASFWMGALYSKKARTFVLDTLGKLNYSEHVRLLLEAARKGLKLPYLAGLADALFPLVNECLKSRGHNEEIFLLPLEKRIRDRTNPAEIALIENSFN